MQLQITVEGLKITDKDIKVTIVTDSIEELLNQLWEFIKKSGMPNPKWPFSSN